MLAAIAIVVTTPVLEDIVDEVTCSGVQVKTLESRDSDPHTFEATPQTVRALKTAEAAIFVGAGLEGWLKPGMLQGATRRLELASVLPLRKDGSSTERRPTVDPHFWHSPRFVLQAAQKIGAFVAGLPGADKTKIAACEKDFEKRLIQAEQTTRNILAKVPPQKRIVAVTHESLAYFGEAFGFRVVSLQGVSTEASPTPEAVRSLVKTIRAEKIKAVFVETGSQRKLMDAVAREAQVTIGGELVADVLAAKGAPGGNILGMWQANAQTIANALN